MAHDEGTPPDATAPGSGAATPDAAAAAPPTRQHETVVEIDAPAAAVWQALTEADHIVRWFAPEARVEPGVGGSLWISWGGGMEGSARITVWEPGRHLRTEMEGPTPPPGPTPVAVDYHLESAAGSRTVLRLVHSGFGAGAAWDDEFDGTRRGWPVFLAILKHDLERHAGEACIAATICRPVAVPAAEAWEILTGPRGLTAEGTLVGLAAGSRYRLRTVLGDELTGVVRRLDSPGYLMVTVEPRHDALLAIYCETLGGQSMVTVSWTLYGSAIGEREGLLATWQGLLTTLFGAVPRPA